MLNTNTRTTHRSILLGIFSVVLTAVFLIAIARHEAVSREDASNLTLYFLFFLPFVQFFSTFLIRREELAMKFAVNNIFSVISYLAMWYCYASGYIGRHLEILSLLLALSLVVWAIWVTYKIMSRPEQPVVLAIVRHSFMTTCFFFGNFLSITYLLGISLAFYDQHLRMQGTFGLYVNPITLQDEDIAHHTAKSIMEEQPDSERAKIVALAEEIRRLSSSLKANNTSVTRSLSDDEQRSITSSLNQTLNAFVLESEFMERLDAHLERLAKNILKGAQAGDFQGHEESFATYLYALFNDILQPPLPHEQLISRLQYTLESSSKSPQYANQLLTEIRELYYLSKPRDFYFLFRDNDIEPRYEDVNMQARNEAVKRVGQYAGQQKVLVDIYGEIGGSSSTLEHRIAEARLYKVQEFLRELISPQDWSYLEWHLVPYSDFRETLELSRYFGIDSTTPTAQEGGVVKVTVTPLPITTSDSQLPYQGVRKMALLDYLYFMIYTITTTGYGDILPASTYAKFVASLANILEVFFVVIFFNVLLSSSRYWRPLFTSEAAGTLGQLTSYLHRFEHAEKVLNSRINTARVRLKDSIDLEAHSKLPKKYGRDKVNKVVGEELDRIKRAVDAYSKGIQAAAEHSSKLLSVIKRYR